MCEDPIPTDSAPSGGGLTDSTPTESDDDPTPVISAPEQLLTCPDLHGCMNNGYSLWGTNEPALKEYLQQCISNFLDLAYFQTCSRLSGWAGEKGWRLRTSEKIKQFWKPKDGTSGKSNKIN